MIDYLIDYNAALKSKVWDIRKFVTDYEFGKCCFYMHLHLF